MMTTAPTGLQMFLALTAAALWLLFLTAYLITARPYRSRIGRVLLLTAGSVAAVFVLIGSSTLFGDYPYKDAVRTFAYGLNILAPGGLLVILVQSQMGRREPPETFERHRRTADQEDPR